MARLWRSMLWRTACSYQGSRVSEAHPTINQQLCTDGKRCLIGSEKHDSIRDLTWLSEPSRGNLLDEGSLLVLRPPGMKGRHNRSGAHRVDANPAGNQFTRQRFRQRNHRGLGCRIDARCRHPDVRIHRSVDYDRRWVREHRQQFLKQKVWTLHVRVERTIKRHRIPLADWLQFGDPRIDKEYVQLSECFSDFVGNFTLLCRIPRVGLDDNCIAQFLASRIQSC